MSIHGVNQVYIDSGGTPEKWSSNTNGGAQVTLYKADGTAYAIGDESTCLPVVSNYRHERGIVGSAAMGDITDDGGNAIVDADLDVRDTTTRYVAVPVGVAGYHGISFGIYTSTAFDQQMAITVYESASPNPMTAITASGLGILATGLLIAASTAVNAVISPVNVGPGGTASTTTIANQTKVYIESLDKVAYMIFRYGFSSAPSTGRLQLDVARW